MKLNQNNNNEEYLNNDNLKINDLIIKIREPHIEIISNDKNTKKINQFYLGINKNFLKILLNSEVKERFKIIEENKNLFEVNKYKEYEDLKVKKRRKKNVTKGKKNDFQSAFMNFLKLSIQKNNN